LDTPLIREARKRFKPRSERSIQIEVVDALRRAYPALLFFSVPNGGYVMEPRVMAALKAEGLLPGVPDLIFIRAGRTPCFIEMKSAKGTVTDAQRAVTTALAARGCPFAVCRSLDDVLTALDSWGVMPGRVA